MTFDKETALIETILFLEAEPLDVPSLSRISGLAREVVVTCLDNLRIHFRDDVHGVELIEIGDGFQFTPKRDLLPSLRDRYGRKNDKRLSRAALETLSIIAYSQPITRTEIENIRGVAADNMIKLLQSRTLIQEVGKKEAPGRPIQYGTTREFLKFFRLASIAELPKLDELDQDRFAEDE